MIRRETWDGVDTRQ